MTSITALRQSRLNLVHSDLWFVTSPTSQSVMEDICFSGTVSSLAAQFRGGLESNKIVGVFVAESDAVKLADALLAHRDAMNDLLLDQWHDEHVAPE